MQEQVNILSAQDYFKKYGEDGIGNGADRWMIKRQLVDAFKKEIFGLISIRTKKAYSEEIPENDPEAIRIAKNVIHDTVMKWKKLCKMFDCYVETKDLLKPDDLKLYDEIGEVGESNDEESREKHEE